MLLPGLIRHEYQWQGCLSGSVRVLLVLPACTAQGGVHGGLGGFPGGGSTVYLGGVVVAASAANTKLGGSLFC